MNRGTDIVIIPRNFKLLEEVIHVVLTKFQTSLKFWNYMFYLMFRLVGKQRERYRRHERQHGLSWPWWYLLVRMERFYPWSYGGTKAILRNFVIRSLNFNTTMSIQTTFDGRLFELRISCGPNYPNVPPQVRFCSRINLASVNQTNGIVQNDLPGLANWTRNSTIESILVSLKQSMSNPANRRLPQPPEGSYF